MDREFVVRAGSVVMTYSDHDWTDQMILHFLCGVPNVTELSREFGTCIDTVNLTGGFMERMPVIEG